MKLVLLFLIISLPFLSSIYNLVEENYYCMVIITGVVLGIACCQRCYSGLCEIRLVDILIFLFIGWILWTTFYLNERIVSDEYIALWIASGMIYVIGRICEQSLGRSWLYIGIAMGGLVQMSYGWLQYLEYIPSRHICFSMTGSFYNPASLAAYLVVSLIALVCLLKYVHACKMKILYGCISLATLAMLGTIIALQSRASWVTILIVAVAWMMMNRKLNTPKVFLVLVFSFLFIVLPLYFFKKDSADGRLFIWRVGCEMVKEAPLAGKGADSFASRYMLAQADYFKNNPDSSYALRATSNTRAFNESLRVLCEYGLIGLLLLISIFITIFRFNSDHCIRAMLLALGIISLFSYIGEVAPLLLMTSLLLGIIQGKVVYRKDRLYRSEVKKIWTASLFSICIFLSIVASWRYVRILKGEFVNAQYNRSYILGTAQRLYMDKAYEEALPFLQRGALLLPGPDLYLDLGNCFMYLGRDSEAEEMFTTARYMVPRHILPRYYLFRLYVEMGNNERAKKVGNEILNEKYKMEGSVALEVKYYVRTYLKRL